MTLFLRSSCCSLLLHATAALGVMLSCRPIEPIKPFPQAPTISVSEYLLITAVNVASASIDTPPPSSSLPNKIQEAVATPPLSGTPVNQQLDKAQKLSAPKKITKPSKIDQRQGVLRDGGLKKTVPLQTATAQFPAAQAKGTTPKDTVDRSDNTAKQANTDQRATPPSRPPANSKEVGYLQMNYEYIRKIISSNLSFPDSARKRQLSGKIEVSFLVGKDGRVDDIHLVSSSGHAILDKNVIQAIRRSAPFPAPPEQARITLPITFRLK